MVNYSPRVVFLPIIFESWQNQSANLESSIIFWRSSSPLISLCELLSPAKRFSAVCKVAEAALGSMLIFPQWGQRTNLPTTKFGARKGRENGS
jgi:hypothetical protein